MNKCSKCGEYKEIDKFDTGRKQCKKCRKIYALNKRRTKEGLINFIFNHQKSSSKSRAHNPPQYTKQELKNWLFCQIKFHKLYDEWSKSEYNQGHTPSIDRLDDSKGYSLDNIQLMNWRENKLKAHKDMREGKLIHGNNPQKKVLQFDLQGNFIKEFCSISNAARNLNINHSVIVNCHKGKYKSGGGFTWKLK